MSNLTVSAVTGVGAFAGDYTLSVFTFGPLYDTFHEKQQSLPAMVNGSIYASVANVAAQKAFGDQFSYGQLLTTVGGVAGAHYLLGPGFYDIVKNVPQVGAYLGSLYTAVGAIAGSYLGSQLFS